jgi:hypothetical protein
MDADGRYQGETMRGRKRDRGMERWRDGGNKKILTNSRDGGS